MPDAARPSPEDRSIAFDWLRTLSVASLVLYHSALVYNARSYGFVVRDPDGSWMVGPLMAALSGWRMPLMFLIAGASIEVMLRRRSAMGVLRLRARRVLPPLLAGFPLVALPQHVVAQLAGSERPLMADLRQVVSAAAAFDVPLYHLWFLWYLLLITVGALAARAVAPRALRPLAGAFEAAAARPAVLFGLAVVPAVVHALPHRITVALTVPGIAGARLLYYACFFAFGMVVARGDQVLACVERCRRAAVLLAAACAAAIAALLLSDAAGLRPLPVVAVAGGQVRLTTWVAALVGGAAGWWGALGAIGYARRYLRRGSPVLVYARDASFAAYLLHQPIVVALGYAAARSQGSPVLEYLAIVVLTSVATIALYEYAIRRTRFLRVVFGLPERVAHASLPALPPWAAPEGARRRARATVSRAVERTA